MVDDQFKNVISHAKEYGFIFKAAKSMTDWALYTIMVNVKILKTTSKPIGGVPWYKCTRILSE